MRRPETDSANAGERLLLRLGLTRNDIAALRRQGFIAAEYCVRGGRRFGPYFKLRWRCGGRQRVRYLGRDCRLAEAVAAAVKQLQEP